MATIEQGVGTGVSFALTEEQKGLRELAREFAEKEIRPKAAEYDEHQTHAAEIVAKARAHMIEKDLMSLPWPEALDVISRKPNTLWTPVVALLTFGVIFSHSLPAAPLRQVRLRIAALPVPT